ncbi:N-acetylmuramoyl-L-alanine amidase family protein [Cohnella luojiensis]|uniref:N-acetylmuramoyl-L-alanine amidase n=1 Tax=Cohnella luojiensis TaxID=652876 RepID=A0A4Y8M1A8_9BACL|nr:N-acetylmuramoyl-L-alanine amidase [Cohnella luojiensis]TFE26279.1 N-acetylmuramoyl-L-alanine amidase [Cohnella luojiensis]
MNPYMNQNEKKRRLARFVALPIFFFLLAGSLFILVGNQSEGSPALSAGPNLSKGPTAQVADSSSQPDRVYKIMIDPGHGGKDPGATGDSGNEEKDLNLSLALKVLDLFKNDPRFEIRLTRTDDTFVELEDRAKLANEWGADVFISIHGNSFEDKNTSGIETYYSFETSTPLAQALHQKMIEAMGFADRGVREDPLRVLSLSEMSAVLIEVGYLSNSAEEAILLSDEGQALAVQAIVESLKEYFMAS